MHATAATAVSAPNVEAAPGRAALEERGAGDEEREVDEHVAWEALQHLASVGDRRCRGERDQSCRVDPPGGAEAAEEPHGERDRDDEDAGSR